MHHAALFNYVEAANYMKGMPNFGGPIASPKSPVALEGRRTSVVQSDSDEDDGHTDKKASSERPRGVKVAKRDIEEGNSVLERIAAQEKDIFLLQHLPSGSARYEKF